MQDQRRIRRTTVNKAAKIGFNDQSLLFDCTVRNITMYGACIETVHSAPELETFALSFDDFRSARACDVVWRDNGFVGVAFRAAATAQVTCAQ